MDIKGLAEGICKKHNSRDPFKIAEQRNIIVLYEPLGSIRGYYSKSLRKAFIHINQVRIWNGSRLYLPVGTNWRTPSYIQTRIRHFCGLQLSFL